MDGHSWCFFFFLTWSGIQKGRLTFLFRMSIFARIPFPGLEADLALGCFFLLQFFHPPSRLQFSTFCPKQAFFNSSLFSSFVFFVQTKPLPDSIGRTASQISYVFLGNNFSCFSYVSIQDFEITIQAWPIRRFFSINIKSSHSNISLF